MGIIGVVTVTTMVAVTVVVMVAVIVVGVVGEGCTVRRKTESGTKWMEVAGGIGVDVIEDVVSLRSDDGGEGGLWGNDIDRTHVVLCFGSWSWNEHIFETCDFLV